jgi:Protein of unknown function (DUF3168)
MSGAVEAVQAAVVAALQANVPLIAELTGIYDGPPPRAAFPYLSISGGGSSDWSTKTARGRELRLGLTIWDDGGEAGRLHRLMALVEDVVTEIPRDLNGWRVANIVYLRSLVARDPAGPWAGLIEFRARVLEV